MRAFIHFTLTAKRLEDEGPVKLKGKWIHDAPQAKLLGVTMDRELRYHAHVARAAE